MKKIYLILIATLILSCTDSKIETTKENTAVIVESNVTEKVPQSDDLLLGTWYVKEILFNGEPDPDNYPVNNDELTLNADGSLITIDKTFNIEEQGSWERLSEDKFKLVLDYEAVVFQILKITDYVLEIRMDTEVADFKIYYKKEK